MEPIRLSALGRDVALGDLYNYHTDNILKSKFVINLQLKFKFVNML